MKRIVVLCAAMVAALFVAPLPSLAAIHSNTLDPIGIVGGESTYGLVTALIHCDIGERVSVRVTVTQEDANSVAQGRASATCTDQVQRIEIRVWSMEMTKLATGAADACALAMTKQDGLVTDTRQWCKAITLNAEQ
jgi:hypothetical protein